MRRGCFWLWAALFLMACSAQPGPQPAPFVTQPANETATASPPPATPGVISTPPVSEAASAAPTVEITVVSEACEGSPVCYLNGHFLFQSPVPLTGPHSVERSYPYGSDQNGQREVHHGVEFYNAFGTPVLAAAPGEVIFAGDDGQTQLAWVPAFYGNVVVLEHELGGEAFFTLYGHLSAVGVSVGQRVALGERIGAVGASGTAIGSHLHFEVRRGEQDYFATRNPELWLKPPEGAGVLAGQIVDGHGSLVPGLVNVQRVEAGVLNPLSVGSALTYTSGGVNGDEVWQESFTLGALPAGEYRLSLVHYGTVYEELVKIEAGRLTFVHFFVK